MDTHPARRAYGARTIAEGVARQKANPPRPPRNSLSPTGCTHLRRSHNLGVSRNYPIQKEYNDEGPIYYLDIGDHKVLFLWGQWVYDPSVFPGSAWHSRVPIEESVLPFPCSHFRLHRCPHSGRVLRVEILGSPIEPVRTLGVHEIPLCGLRESEVLEGGLDDLFSVMQQASRPLSQECT